jgi:Na+/H+-dicarboxylate symporter
MMIAPIVFCTIVSGITSLANGRAIGRTIVRALALFYLPDRGRARVRARRRVRAAPRRGHARRRASPRSEHPRAIRTAAPRGLVAFALDVIPDTMLGAFRNGDVLLVLLSLLFGFALNAHPQAGRPVLALIDGVAQVVFRVLAMIMRLAPLGAFGAMAFTVGCFGIGSVGSLAWLIVSFYVACVLFVALVPAPPRAAARLVVAAVEATSARSC